MLYCPLLHSRGYQWEFMQFCCSCWYVV